MDRSTNTEFNNQNRDYNSEIVNSFFDCLKEKAKALLDEHPKVSLFILGTGTTAAIVGVLVSEVKKG